MRIGAAAPRLDTSMNGRDTTDMSHAAGIDPSVPPSGPGCVECTSGLGAGWWVHLRRCAQCGHVGCCDSSPSRHATGHNRETGHPVMRSYEPGENWFWSYEDNDMTTGPELAHPLHHPLDQPVPGPAGRVPSNWQQLLG